MADQKLNFLSHLPDDFRVKEINSDLHNSVLGLILPCRMDVPQLSYGCSTAVVWMFHSCRKDAPQ